ncbi:MAG TPA: carboxypeptidase-like regulatory domain-containing protein, partial [Planctomycetaceae bacterium]|nr:carboxypeptidase-like regulatory domain-containing protein [Planctomycetaceae bacterium]
KATDGPTKIPAEQTPQSSATPIKFRTIRLINGMTDRPLAGIKIRVNAAVAGKEELESMEFVSDAQGLIQIPVHNQSSPSNDQAQKKAAMVIVTDGWFHRGTHMIVIKGEATDVPEEPQVYQLWPGQTVTGRLLFPDKTPAAGVLLSVGVYINNQEWGKRLGMDLGVNSFDHGDWPNWSTRVVTKDDGTFSVTVPPEDARWWVRVGTTALGFGAIINPDDLDDRQTGRALRECIPFEAQIGWQANHVAVVTSPHLGQEAGVLNFGDLQLKAGVEVRGRVVDAEGNGLAGVHLTTQGLHGPHSGRSTRSRENGEFNFLPIEPGSLTIRPDARLRAENGQVSSRDVQAVFVDQTYPIFKGLDLVVKAVPHVELEFDWIDRRAEEAPVSYYGRFIVNGYYQVDESQRVWWRGETNLVERDGRQLLVVKVPRDLLDAKLHLSQDRVVTASYVDETGKTSGPGAIELGDVTQPIKRTIFGDEPTKQ